MKKKTILIAGAGGFIGSALAERLKGQNIIGAGRQDFAMDDHSFVNKYEPADVIINFSGTPIMKRWTPKNRRKIMESRIETTRKLGLVPTRGMKKARRFINASAIGIYSEGGEHTENSYGKGTGFMKEVIENWENEAMKIMSGECSVTVLRLGVVLSRNGGVIAKLLPIFRMGMGGRIGDGQQAFSWIHMEDLLRAVEFILEDDQKDGIYNMVSPGHCKNIDFTQQLAKALNRPAFLGVPATALKWIYGKGSEVVTKGQAVLPQRLMTEGFKFKYPDIKSALREVVD